ncbi:MAG: hypothetical protein IJE40_06025, partial [Clostridia bacterium]|nr:hypothetical protein [Clostridia bacterium]
MKTKKNLIIAFISLLVVMFSTFSTAAELGTNEEIEQFIATGYSLLESVTVNTSSLVDFETAETLTVGDLTLYKCKDEFQPYDAMKQKLFSYLSPQLVITAMREYGNIFNINGDLYVYPTEGKFPAVLGAVKSLNYQTHTVNIVLAAKDSNRKEVTSEYRLVYTYDRQGGLDTGAYFDCIKGIIGDKGGERYLNEKYCVDYGTAAIRDYIISENLKAGYEKYPVKLSPEAPFMPEGIEAKYIKWDSYANVYTYAELNESDKNGNDLGARYLFTELHKDSQKIVSDTTDYDNLFALSTEYMNFIEKTVGCCGTLHDGGELIKVGDIEYYPMVGEFSDYEKFKEYMLERFTDAFTSYILTENMNFLNIDGKTYVRGDRNQPFVEGGLKYNAVEVIEASSNYSFVVRLMCKENEEILYEHNLYFTYEEEGVRLNGLSEYEKSKYGDHYYYQVYTYADTKDYYHGIYLSYLLTENLRAGYEKYKINTVSPDSPYLSGLDIRNAQHRGAESYALVSEYDKDGKISQYHKIYVSSSTKTLENTIEDIILSSEEYKYEKTRILIADTEAKAHDVLIYFFESGGSPLLEYGNGPFKYIGYEGVSYDDYKNQLLNIASPHLAMNVLGYYHSILNINGD